MYSWPFLPQHHYAPGGKVQEEKALLTWTSYVRKTPDDLHTLRRLKMLGDFLKASDLPYSSSLARVPSKWLLAHRPTPIATPWQQNRLDYKCALVWKHRLVFRFFIRFFGYLSFNGIIVSRCEQDFLQLFLHHFFIETLLENHSNALIQETLKKDNSLKLL